MYNTKTDKTTTVRWQPHLDPLLNEWRDKHRPSYTTSDSPYLFTTQQADKVAPNHISRIIREAAERAGIQEVLYEDNAGDKRRRVTSHALRHSFAVHWLQPPNKGSLEELQEILAHEDVQTTQVYTDIVEEQVDQAYTTHAPTIGYDADPSRNKHLCEPCGERKSQLDTHHISYGLEETMDVCSNCHREIQDGSSYDYLKPEESREEAKDRDALLIIIQPLQDTPSPHKGDTKGRRLSGHQRYHMYSECQTYQARNLRKCI